MSLAKSYLSRVLLKTGVGGGGGGSLLTPSPSGWSSPWWFPPDEHCLAQCNLPVQRCPGRQSHHRQTARRTKDTQITVNFVLAANLWRSLQKQVWRQHFTFSKRSSSRVSCSFLLITDDDSEYSVKRLFVSSSMNRNSRGPSGPSSPDSPPSESKSPSSSVSSHSSSSSSSSSPL